MCLGFSVTLWHGKEKRNRKKQAATKERKKNWKEYTATVEDIQNFLMDRIMLRHNVVTQRVESLSPAPSPIGKGRWVPINDRIVNSLWAELSATKAVRAQDIYRVIESDFVPDYHPFRFYLDHLPPWNGEDYILAMSVSVSVRGEMDQQLLFAQYLKKWLVSGSRTLALLFGHRLVGQVLGILLLECIEKLRILVVYRVAERLSMPFS